jgi:N-acyl homoserine lactone hydrolase
MPSLPTALTLSLALATAACSTTSHPAEAARDFGKARSSAEMVALIDTPGSVQLETVTSADWSIDRAGLINLEHPTAQKAGLEDGLEPIQVYFHVLTHPTRWTFLVDTGVETALRDAPERAVLRGLSASAMGAERMQVKSPLGVWLREHDVKPAGVLLTHLHGDHVLGLPDVPRGTPIYTGPGEGAARSALNVLVQPLMNDLLEGHAPLQELRFAGPDPLLRALDLFGDGMVWALHTPGHTPGHLSFLVRTPGGSVLLTGDASHTAWGWEHEVEPGEFTSDHEANAEALTALRKLAQVHPTLQVRLGHQPLSALPRNAHAAPSTNE